MSSSSSSPSPLPLRPLRLIMFLLLFVSSQGFHNGHHQVRPFSFPTSTSSSSSSSSSVLFATDNDDNNESETNGGGGGGGGGVEEYKNVATKVLSNFMQKESMMMEENPLDDIDFTNPQKIPSTTSLETLASALDYELIEKEWFVTGKVNPIYFSDEFEFQDPDVQLKGIEDYARGVYKLFDQSTSRAEIISTIVNTTTASTTTDDDENPVITCTWRLSGKVNIGFGLPIKPYIVQTDFTIDPKTSLIIFQEDRFDIPGWDILLSALFPFLIGTVTAPPAPEVSKRVVTMPPNLLKGGNGAAASSGSNPLDSLMNLFNK